MSDKYILEGDTIKPADDLIEWAKWFGSADRRIALDYVREAKVSTVFLGIDYNFLGEGDPILFETMTFGAQHEHMERYRTKAEALEGHARILKLVKEELT